MCRYKCIFSSNIENMQELLISMSPALRRDVAVHTCYALTTRVPYFKNCDASFLMECAMLIDEVVFAPMELAIVRGAIIAHLTVIRKGVIVANGRVLTAGRVLGEESLYKECPAAYTARSMTFTDASQLHRADVLKVLATYPSLMRACCLRSIQVVFRLVSFFCDYPFASLASYHMNHMYSVHRAVSRQTSSVSTVFTSNLFLQLLAHLGKKS
jgi:hypothetical protein